MTRPDIGNWRSRTGNRINSPTWAIHQHTDSSINMRVGARHFLHHSSDYPARNNENASPLRLVNWRAGLRLNYAEKAVRMASMRLRLTPKSD